MMSMAEAKILVTVDGKTCDSVDFDPVMIPVVEYVPGTEIPYLTDVTNPGLVRLINAVIEAEMDSDLIGRTHALVWSDCGFHVQGYCVDCDDAFVVVEGMPAGDDGIVCGCIDD